MTEISNLCPCGSALPYSDCCQPLHDNTAIAACSNIAKTAEQLMRSRYTAFVLQNVDYIIATTVPAQQALLDKQAISDWAKQTDWAGLEVLNFNPKVDKNHASVEFKAFFHELENGIPIQKERKKFHHELSFFVKIQQHNQAKWYFLDPTVPLAVSQKQPCICGSGEKFKRCCGKFI